MAATAPNSPQDPATHAAALLYERHASRVLAECAQRLRRREDAEEAAQATFLRAFSALRRGQRPRAERAWLLTIARNVCATNATRARRRAEVELEPHVLEQIAAAVEVERGVDEELQRALAALPEGQRRAIVLLACHGMSYREIAAELGVSVAAIESWIFRARGSLATALGGTERRRRARALDLSSLLGALKSLLGGGAAAKVVLACVVAGTTLGAAELTQRSGHEPARARAVEPRSAGPAATESTKTPQPASSRARGARPSESRAAAVIAPTTAEPVQPASPPQQAPSSAPSETEAPPASDSSTTPPTTSTVSSVEEALPAVPLPEAEVPLPEVPELPVEPPPLNVPELPRLETPTLP